MALSLLLLLFLNTKNALTSALSPSFADLSTLDTLLALIHNQTESTLSPSGYLRNSYAFNLHQPKVPIPNQGLGHPAKQTGMVKTSFRRLSRPSPSLPFEADRFPLPFGVPASDDPVIFPYNIPVNALLVVELRGLATILEKQSLRPYIVNEAREVADRVEKAIWEWGVEERPGWGKVFAYEVDGFGGRVFVSSDTSLCCCLSALTPFLFLPFLPLLSISQMDDANVPSLLSLPYLGFLSPFPFAPNPQRPFLSVLTPHAFPTPDASHPVYQSTRRMLMNQEGNP